jgi:YHS domain-containing protein
MKFDSPLARVALRFALTHDAEVKHLVLSQNLEILPILMRFEGESQLVVPLDKIDEQQVARWFDDRIVSFVQTIAAMHRNQNYLKGHLVTDPIAGVQLPKYAAKSTLEADGQTYYFISEDSKREFEQQRKSAGKK